MSRPAPVQLAELLAWPRTTVLSSWAGDLVRRPWPRWLFETIFSGGDGHCRHDTMRRRSDTSAILADILHRDGRLSGIVDWNVPFTGSAQGDRGFDLATLLFYLDDDAGRRRLWGEAVRVSGARSTTVYLAHVVLRQVGWTVRHRPGTPDDDRFVALAEAVLDDGERLTP